MSNFVAQWIYNLAIKNQKASSPRTQFLHYNDNSVLRKVIFYATCGLWSPFRVPFQSLVESPTQSVQPIACKCGKREEVFEFSENLQSLFRTVSIGVLTWVPCPIHQCQHSPPVTTDESRDVPTEELDGVAAVVEQECLCPREAQIAANPELKARQEYWFLKNWSI